MEIKELRPLSCINITWIFGFGESQKALSVHRKLAVFISGVIRVFILSTN